MSAARDSITSMLKQNTSPNVLMESLLLEIFGSPVASIGALALANHSAYRQAPITSPSNYLDMDERPKGTPRSYLPALDRAMLDLVGDVMNMIQRAHVSANRQIEPLGLRYEIKGAIPLDNLFHLTTRVPDMLNISIELRDVHFPRRLTQAVKYRIGTSIKHKNVSVRVMDPKVQIYPPKVIFHLHPDTQEFDIRKFEDKLIARLVDRAKSAFKREDIQPEPQNKGFPQYGQFQLQRPH